MPQSFLVGVPRSSNGQFAGYSLPQLPEFTPTDGTKVVELPVEHSGQEGAEEPMPLTVDTTSDQLPGVLAESTLGTPRDTGDKLKPLVVA